MTALTEDQIANLLDRKASVGVKLLGGAAQVELFICSAEEWTYLLSHKARADGLEERVRELEIRRDELFAETKRAQRIIDELALWRERILTSRPSISAERVELILAEDARYDDGLITNAGYLAVRIAESVESDWRALVEVSPK